MTVNLFRQCLERRGPLGGIARQGFEVPDRLAEHLTRRPRSQLRHKRPTGVRHDGLA
jgi:hypothetical protein